MDGSQGLYHFYSIAYLSQKMAEGTNQRAQQMPFILNTQYEKMFSDHSVGDVYLGYAAVSFAKNIREKGKADFSDSLDFSILKKKYDPKKHPRHFLSPELIVDLQGSTAKSI